MVIFSDFDGTIAQNDVGDLLFQTFGDVPACAGAVQAWLDNKISSRTCLQREAETARVTQQQLDEFCDTQPLAKGFIEFEKYCRQKDWRLYVLSDGLDYYIRRILSRYDLELPVFSNVLKFLPPESGTIPDRIAVEFPFFEYSCGRCGNCKSYHVRRLARPNQKSVYIGDGFSDRCGAQAADMICAKGDLAAWCISNRMPYFPFGDFEAIACHLSS
ncbi:MAG: MtnX-like HAD-IB family phosphatase [bacterium]